MPDPARHLRPVDTAWQASDPVLAALRTARDRRDQADRDIRILLAYARELATPRPYRLADLAEAVGKSISGVRVAYTPRDTDIARHIIQALTASPTSATQPGDSDHDLSRPPGRASIRRQEVVDTETALQGRGKRRVRRVPPPRHPRLQPPRRRW